MIVDIIIELTVIRIVQSEHGDITWTVSVHTNIKEPEGDKKYRQRVINYHGDS